jgi:hypothetical protein
VNGPRQGIKCAKPGAGFAGDDANEQIGYRCFEEGVGYSFNIWKEMSWKFNLIWYSMGGVKRRSSFIRVRWGRK